MPRMTAAPTSLQPRRTRPVRFGLLVLGSLMLAPSASQIWAQEFELTRVVAVVNDEPISVHDLAARVRLTVATLGAPDGEGEQERMVQEVLESLIDERLKVQAAERLAVEIRGNEAEAAYARFAGTFGMDPESFTRTLRQQSISEVTVWTKIDADLRWGQIIRRQVVVAPDEVDAEIASIRAAEGQPEFRIRRIVLLVDGNRDRAAVRAEADRLRNQLEAGADFGLLALRHSQGLPDSPGGDWVRGDAVDPTLAESLAQLETGAVSAPVETAGAVYLIELLDRRAVTVPDNEAALRRQADELVFRRNALTTDRTLMRQLRASALIDRRL